MHYKFLNLNPLGELELDCVCRAISLATNEHYYDIEHKLNLIGDLFGCEELCVCCYKFLLDNVFGFNRYEEYQGSPIIDFLYEHPYGVYIIRVDGHLTCAVDGQVLDTWDCSQEIIDIIWEVEN